MSGTRQPGDGAKNETKSPLPELTAWLPCLFLCSSWAYVMDSSRQALPSPNCLGSSSSVFIPNPRPTSSHPSGQPWSDPGSPPRLAKLKHGFMSQGSGYPGRVDSGWVGIWGAFRMTTYSGFLIWRCSLYENSPSHTLTICVLLCTNSIWFP